MWWDGLTEEEIQERLRNEGIFTPLLERIDAGDDEAKAELILALKGLKELLEAPESPKSSN